MLTLPEGPRTRMKRPFSRAASTPPSEIIGAEEQHKPSFSHTILQLLVAALFCISLLALAQKPTPAADASRYVGDQACVGCHAKIYKSHSKTSMAHASGLAADNVIPADFVHRKSGIHFRVYP